MLCSVPSTSTMRTSARPTSIRLGGGGGLGSLPKRPLNQLSMVPPYHAGGCFSLAEGAEDTVPDEAVDAVVFPHVDVVDEVQVPHPLVAWDQAPQPVPPDVERIVDDVIEQPDGAHRQDRAQCHAPRE